jgi:hypothetical protein
MSVVRRSKHSTFCLVGRCTFQLCYGRAGFIDSKSFPARASTVLDALIFCAKVWRPIYLRNERNLLNLSH